MTRIAAGTFSALCAVLGSQALNSCTAKVREAKSTCVDDALVNAHVLSLRSWPYMEEMICEKYLSNVHIMTIYYSLQCLKKEAGRWEKCCRCL